jgi:ribosomal RNA assembly protein
METIQIKSTHKIRQNKEAVEKKLSVKITIKGKQAIIEGEPVEEYEALTIIDALDFGFSIKDAIRLTDENVVFRKLPIKQFTTRKNLEEVRGRIIGTEGKTLRAIEEVSGCGVVLHENTVGIIGEAENIEEATTALKSLIKGSKQANVYKFLERMNAAKREKVLFK